MAEAEIKGEHNLHVSEAAPVRDKNLPKSKRVASLDIFRGLAVVVLLRSPLQLSFHVQNVGYYEWRE